MAHTLPKLPFAMDALEPYLDRPTMEIHYGKHHQAYVDNLNKALEAFPKLQSWPLEDLIVRIGEAPEKIRTAVRNNAGQHLNHLLYWQCLSPHGGKPEGAIAEVIVKTFGSFVTFQEQFTKAGITQFGSGWIWLAVHQKKLEILSTPNQENPISSGLRPILACDVWEHAYYLKYQNRRAEYITAWWNVVDWKAVMAAYVAALK